MLDLYFREDNLSIFGEKIFEIESDLDILISQIEMILKTPKGSVYNFPDYGNSLEAYLHELNADEKDIESHILGQIQEFCPLNRDIPISVESKFFTGQISDVVVVDILIDSRKVLGVLVK